MNAIALTPDSFERAGRYNLSGMGQADTGTSTSALSELGDVLTQAAKLYGEYDLQKTALEIQADRARAGLPPLDMSAYGAGVNVGFAPSTQNTLLIIAGVAAAALILPKLLK